MSVPGYECAATASPRRVLVHFYGLIGISVPQCHQPGVFYHLRACLRLLVLNPLSSNDSIVTHRLVNRPPSPCFHNALYSALTPRHGCFLWSFWKINQSIINMWSLAKDIKDSIIFWNLIYFVFVSLDILHFPEHQEQFSISIFWSLHWVSERRQDPCSNASSRYWLAPACSGWIHQLQCT